MAGTIIVDTINSSVASTPPVFQANGTQIGTLCRAWVNFDGTGTVAIRASFNVSSITDNGTGDYTVNFTTAMPDANFCALGWTTGFTTTDPTRHTIIYGSFASGASGKTTSAVRVQSGAGDAATYADSAEMNIAVFR